MKNIFPGYVEVLAPPDDDAKAKWSAVDQASKPTLQAAFAAFDRIVLPHVNVEVNSKVKYRVDPDDHWQPAAETIALMTGDCEDFAILKWFLLSLTGYHKPDDFAMVIGEAAGAPHAFLVVRLPTGDVVLDNRFDHLIAPADYLNWRPVKVVTEGTVFLFAKEFRIADLVKAA